MGESLLVLPSSCRVRQLPGSLGFLSEPGRTEVDTALQARPGLGLSGAGDPGGRLLAGSPLPPGGHTGPAAGPQPIPAAGQVSWRQVPLASHPQHVPIIHLLSFFSLLGPSSPQDSRLYLVFPHDSSALSHSFHHLQLFDDDSSNVVSVSLWSEGWRGPHWAWVKQGGGKSIPWGRRRGHLYWRDWRKAHYHLLSFIPSSAFSPGSLCSHLWWFLTGDQLFSRSPSASS